MAKPKRDFLSVKNPVQVNVNLAADDARALDTMAREMGYDNRSAFVRWLIRQEWARRYSQPNPDVTVAEALEAAQAVEK